MKLSKITIPVILVSTIMVLVAYALLKWAYRNYYKQNPQNMKTSNIGKDLIKEFEALELQTYADPGGVLTIGYGHTGPVDGVPLHFAMQIDEETANELLEEDLAWAEKLVKKSIQINLTQNQFDALVSHAYNTGLASPDLYRKINEQQGEVAITQQWISTYITQKGVLLNGLVRRRSTEVELFFV